MSDPTVTAYLTKLLCSHSGRLERNQLANLLDLSSKQIEQILQEELLRFPQCSQLVLVRSPLRICTNYLHPKGEKEEEEKCLKLHLCRDYLRGQCLPNRRPRCRFSHDVLSDHNHAVLKANELSGLNEEEIKVLLFQNDNQLLPPACRKYMSTNCEKEEDCTRLHVCIYFMRGECNNRSCKRSHNLLESNLLLACSWLSQETIQNFQMLCVLTHNERQWALREEPRNEEPSGTRGMSQGIGRGKPGKRRAGSQNRNSERRNKGPHIHQQSDSSLRSRSNAGQRLGDKNNDVKLDDSGKISTTRLESLMDDWFSPNISPPGNVQGRSSRTSAGVTPQEGTRSVPSTKDLFVLSNEKEPELLWTPALPKEFYNSRVAQPFPSEPFIFPKMGPPNTASVAPIISQSYTTQSYYHLSNTPMIPPGKEASTYQPALLSTPSQPTFLTLKSDPSITSPGVLTSSTSFSPSKVGAPTQVKPPTGSASLSTVSLIPSLPSKKLVTSSRERSFIAEPNIISLANTSSVSGKSEKSSTRSPSTANQVLVKKLGEKSFSPVAEPANIKPIPSSKTAISKPATSAAPGHLEQSSSLLGIANFCSVSNRADTPSRKQTDIKPIKKPDASSRNQQHPSGLIDLQSKSTNSTASEPQPTTNISSVKPQKSVKNVNELGTWTKYQQLNTKKVCSSIKTLELETIYLSNPTRTIQFTAGNQKDNLNCQKINMHHLAESEMHQKLEFLDFDRVKTLKGSIKSDTNHSKPKPVDFPLKVVNYPPMWDLKVMPETGYQNIPVPQTCDEFSTLAKMFSKTVQGYKVWKVWRIQNPTLWQAYQRQKDQMKKKNFGIDVNERQLFHGTDCINVTTICKDNFDWRLCRTNGILYGQGNYFARDASYAHNYSPATSAGTRTMFVAQVLVGDFIKGDPSMRCPPQKSTESYNSCVNNVTNPSVFVVYEKSQVYPEYILEYNKKSACVIN